VELFSSQEGICFVALGGRDHKLTRSEAEDQELCRWNHFNGKIKMSVLAFSHGTRWTKEPVDCKWPYWLALCWTCCPILQETDASFVPTTHINIFTFYDGVPLPKKKLEREKKWTASRGLEPGEM
jgi:hypothetical protein